MKNIFLSDVNSLLKTKFANIWISQVLSQLSINIMNFLLLIKLFGETKSTVATSFLWVSYALPALLIGPFAAVLVDMYDKRKILIVTNFLQSLVVLIYALTINRQTFLPYGVAFMYSFLNQFYLPAESSTVPVIVDKIHLPRANSLFFITQQASLVLGFGFAGSLNHLLGFELSFFLCALLLFFAFISVIFLPSLEVVHNIQSNIEKEFIGFFEKIFEGYNFIKNNKSILFPSLLLMLIQIILAVLTVNVPIIAKDLLHIDINNSGLLIFAPAAIGSAFGAIIIPQLLKNGWRKRRLIEKSIMLCILSFFSIVFIIPEQTLILKIILIFILIASLGLSFVGILIPSQTFLQEKTPGGLRGRVFGNFWFLTTAATIVPVILSGTITELFGIKLMFFLISVFLTISLIVFRKYRIKEVRTI